MIKLKDLIKEMWGEEVPRNYDAPDSTQVGSPMHIWQTDTGTPDEVINVIHNIIKSIHMKLGQQAQPMNYIKLYRNSNGWKIQNPHTEDKWMIFSPQNRWWAPIEEGGGVQLVPLNSDTIEKMIQNWA